MIAKKDNIPLTLKISIYMLNLISIAFRRQNFNKLHGPKLWNIFSDYGFEWKKFQPKLHININADIAVLSIWSHFYAFILRTGILFLFKLSLIQSISFCFQVEQCWIKIEGTLLLLLLTPMIWKFENHCFKSSTCIKLML